MEQMLLEGATEEIKQFRYPSNTSIDREDVSLWVWKKKDNWLIFKGIKGQ